MRSLLKYKASITNGDRFREMETVDGNDNKMIGRRAHERFQVQAYAFALIRRVAAEPLKINYFIRNHTIYAHSKIIIDYV
jgi:hypothetical protein